MDEEKTKDQLIDELMRLRLRVAELEEAERECKRAEEALRNSQERLNLALRSSKAGTWDRDIPADRATWDEHLHALFGLVPGTFSGKLGDFLCRLHPDDRERIRGEMTAAMNGDADYATTYRVVWPDSSVHVLADRGKLYRDNQGRPVRMIGVNLDVTELKQAAEALRESQQQLADIINFLPDATFVIDKEGKVIFWNKAIEEMTGIKAADILGRGNYEYALPFYGERRPILIDLVLQRREEVEARYVSIDGEESVLAGEAYMPALKGSVAYLFGAASILRDSKGNVVGAVESIRDITELKQAETLLRLQRDLALVLGSTNSMVDALGQLLDAAMKIEDIDSGGVYVVEQGTGSLSLISHIGLSSSFVAEVSRYAAETLQARFAMKGEPIYWPNVRGVLGIGPLLEKEGLTSLAVIPVKFHGKVIAVLNLASHVRSEVSESTRSAIETIAAQIGGVVSRVNMDEDLKLEQKKLAEANTALKVLLRQREEDRRELEESLLTNVKNLVLPFAEKLKNTRLTSEQVLFLEIIEAHLKEIASPFLRTLSREYARLTPMEIRVADLIRDDRTSKEVAQILGISVNAVLFHRKNLRRKLGLRGRKANLKSHFVSLS